MIDHLVVKLMLLSLSCPSLILPDECVGTGLGVAVNHVCFHLVTQFYTPLYTNVY